MQAFSLFDADGDGVISREELQGLVARVGGEMSEAEAVAHIAQADKVTSVCFLTSYHQYNEKIACAIHKTPCPS